VNVTLPSLITTLSLVDSRDLQLRYLYTEKAMILTLKYGSTQKRCQHEREKEELCEEVEDNPKKDGNRECWESLAPNCQQHNCTKETL